MDLIKTTEKLQAWGGWLQAQLWDTFVTYTFRYDISLKRSEMYMSRLANELLQEQIEHTIFWVAECPHTPYQSHLHILIQGEQVQAFMLSYFLSKGLIIERNVQVEPYDPTLGAAFYVSKSLNSQHVAYDISHFAQ